MHNNRQKIHFTGKLKLLAAITMLLPVSLAVANEFASSPLYLQNEVRQTTSQVKPNVMLLIDDSGSMDDAVDGGGGWNVRRTTRMNATKEALNTIVQQYGDEFNWSLRSLWGSQAGKYGSVLNMNHFTDGSSGNNYQVVVDRVARLKSGGATPTTRVFYETSKVVRDNLKYRCQNSYIVLMSDGDANVSCNKFDVNGRVFRMQSGLPYFYTPYFYTIPVDPYFGRPPFGENRVWETSRYQDVPQQWRGQQYIGGQCVLGAGNEPADTAWDMGDGLKFFSHTLATKDIKSSSDGQDAAGKSWDDPAFPKQIAHTYTIGFGGGLSVGGRDYLRRAATVDNGFSEPTTAEQLKQTFQTIAADIQADSQTNRPVNGYGSVAPAVFGTDVPNMAATISLDTGSWSSQIRFFQLNKNGQADSQSYVLPSFNGRRFLIRDEKGMAWARPAMTNNRYNNAHFGIGTNAQNSNSNEWKDALLPWTIRADSDDNLIANAKRQGFSIPYRLRPNDPDERNLGDILNSPLVPAGGEANGRQQYLITAANDGMVHLFESQNDSNAPYALKLSYMPAAMQRDGSDTVMKTLKDVAHEQYGKDAAHPHRYLVDGGIVVRTTARSTTQEKQQIFAVGNMGQGARGAYALNIGGTNRASGNPAGLSATPNRWINSVPLFETEKGSVNTFGYTIGSPQIGRVSLSRSKNARPDIDKNVRYAAFISSGFPSQKGQAIETALYVYDALGQEARSGKKVDASNSGKLLKKIVVSDGIGGLAAPTLLDTDFDGIVDLAYAGDYHGNMFRFDFRGEPSTWQASKIFAGDGSQPITSAPAVSRRKDSGKYVVIIGTGSEIYQSDLSDKSVQAVYGIFDDVTRSATVASNLQTQTVSDNDHFRSLSNNPISRSHGGWHLILPAGERVVVKPTMILRTAVVGSRNYNVEQQSKASADVCMPTIETTDIRSESWITAINAETGGALSKKGKDTYLNFGHVSGDYVVNGKRFEGMVNFNFVDPNRLKRKNPNPSTSVDGDAGGSGIDDDLTQTPTVPRNNCFSGKEARYLLTNISGSGLGEAVGVEGRQCALNVRRISWRELF